MRTIERHLQQCLNKIENWALFNGFKFSKSKTQCVHFCQLRKLHDNPQLYLYGTLIPVVDEAKFLGVIFDQKLLFIPHIKYLKAKCLKALNLLKVLSHTIWGTDRTVLLHLYWYLIRSKLDYGAIVYGGARWLSGRVSDSGARGPGFETYRRRVVSLSKTLYSPKVLVNYPGSDGSVPT